MYINTENSLHAGQKPKENSNFSPQAFEVVAHQLIRSACDVKYLEQQIPSTDPKINDAIAYLQNLIRKVIIDNVRQICISISYQVAIIKFC